MWNNTPLNLTRFQRDRSGAVAVEFVLIAPILFALLFGVITLGHFMGISHSLNQVTAEAVQTSVTDLDKTERSSLANAYFSKACSRYPLLTPGALTTNVTFDGSDPAGITVTVAYDVEGLLLDVASGFLGRGITTIDGIAYLAI